MVLIGLKPIETVFRVCSDSDKPSRAHYFCTNGCSGQPVGVLNQASMRQSRRAKWDTEPCRFDLSKRRASAGLTVATLRKELERERGLRSFHAASDWMTQKELGEYLGFARSTLSELRTKRKLAKSEEEKAVAFAPEYGAGAWLRFRRSEIDVWMQRHRR